MGEFEPLNAYEVTLEGDNGTTVTRTVSENETFDIASLIDNGDLDTVVDIDVEVAGSTEKSDESVSDGDTVSVDDSDLQPGNILAPATIFGVSGSITDHGSVTIDGPNDSLGSGYYDGITAGFADRGRPTINSPGDIPGYYADGYYDGFDNNIDTHGEGYYSGISNNIDDQGSISDLSPGEDADSGYYDSGTVPGLSGSTSLVDSSGDYVDKNGTHNATETVQGSISGSYALVFGTGSAETRSFRSYAKCTGISVTGGSILFTIANSASSGNTVTSRIALVEVNSSSVSADVDFETYVSGSNKRDCAWNAQLHSVD